MHFFLATLYAERLAGGPVLPTADPHPADDRDQTPDRGPSAHPELVDAR